MLTFYQRRSKGGTASDLCSKPTRWGEITDSASNRMPFLPAQETYTHVLMAPLFPVRHSSFHTVEHVGGGSYLHQGMPVCDGLPRIRQHFTPVVSAQPLGFVAYLTHADDLIVTYTVKMAHNSFFLKLWHVGTVTTQ